MGKIAARTDCSATWTLAKEWLDSCIKTHHACNNSLAPPKLPTRLLDIGSCDAEVSLVLSSALTPDTLYFTLSHCWGKTPFTVLTRGNLRDFQSRIPFQRLTRTFREAITSTRRLGYRYLWIDSLCIIQGDKEDWKLEAQSMASVYTNSILNIAATDSPDGARGLFVSRTYEEIVSRKVEITRERDGRKFYWRCVDRQYIDNSGDFSKIHRKILYSRAWAFQERFLAPRTLHFGADQLAWECRCLEADEICPDGRQKTSRATSVNLQSLLTCPPWIAKDTSYVVIYWYFLVNSYSKAELTFAPDKLVAIADIARLFASHFGGKYLLGLVSTISVIIVNP